jgi:hypothetical protein
VNWLWLNIPLMVLFAAAVAGIPLWLVLRRPDFGPETASLPGRVSGTGRGAPWPGAAGISRASPVGSCPSPELR